MICNTYNGSPALAQTTEAPSRTTEAPSGATEAPSGATEAPVSVQAEGAQTLADAAGMVPSVQASGTSQRVMPVYGSDYVNIQDEHTPLVIGSDTKVILQGKAAMQGKNRASRSVWGDEGSSITFEEGFFNIQWVTTTVIKIENALVFNCSFEQQDYSKNEWDRMGFTMFSQNLDLESVWIEGQKYDVSGLGIQGTRDLMLIAMNPKKVKTINIK